MHLFPGFFISDSLCRSQALGNSSSAGILLQTFPATPPSLITSSEKNITSLSHVCFSTMGQATKIYKPKKQNLKCIHSKGVWEAVSGPLNNLNCYNEFLHELLSFTLHPKQDFWVLPALLKVMNYNRIITNTEPLSSALHAAGAPLPSFRASTVIRAMCQSVM